MSDIEDDINLPACQAVLVALMKGLPMLTHTTEQALFLSMLTADIIGALEDGGFLK